MTNTFHIINYGCQMNVLEYEKMKGLLINSGLSYESDEFNSDIVIFNTCCVRDTAERKIYGKIGQLNKKGKSGLVIAVGGCVSQIEGEKIFKEYPFVNIVFGTNNKSRLLSYIESAICGERVLDLSNYDSDHLIDHGINAIRKSKYIAYVEIMKGCNNYCSYCIVPYARGEEISNTPENVIKEISILAEKGYREFVLLGQNVNSYGRKFIDGKKRDIEFSTLLSSIADISDVSRIKFITSHPRDLTKELMDLMAGSTKISNFLHLPVQSGSNRILDLMNRGYTRDQYMEKIAYLRELIPDISLTTDLMVGFPGETERDFQDSVDLLEGIRFNKAFLFRYSDRKDTKASEICEERVEESVKLERLHKIIELQNKITYERSQDYVGTVSDVLFDSYDRTKNNILGRDSHDMIVVSEFKDNVFGNMSRVFIQRANSFTLFGKIIQ